jgi:hypothetical protein
VPLNAPFWGPTVFRLEQSWFKTIHTYQKQNQELNQNKQKNCSVFSPVKFQIGTTQKAIGSNYYGSFNKLGRELLKSL